MKFRNWLLIVGVSIMLAFSCFGCIKSTDTQGRTTYQADPNIVTKVEQGVEQSIGILTILGAFWPILLPIATAVGGGLATYKKIKPQVTSAQTEAKIYYNTTASIVVAIEDLKKQNPKSWEDLRDRLYDTIGENGEAVIRGMRGLPPVE